MVKKKRESLFQLRDKETRYHHSQGAIGGKIIAFLNAEERRLEKEGGGIQYMEVGDNALQGQAGRHKG